MSKSTTLFRSGYTHFIVTSKTFSPFFLRTKATISSLFSTTDSCRRRPSHRFALHHHAAHVNGAAADEHRVSWDGIILKVVGVNQLITCSSSQAFIPIIYIFMIQLQLLIDVQRQHFSCFPFRYSFGKRDLNLPTAPPSDQPLITVCQIHVFQVLSVFPSSLVVAVRVCESNLG